MATGYDNFITNWIAGGQTQNCYNGAF